MKNLSELPTVHKEQVKQNLPGYQSKEVWFCCAFCCYEKHYDQNQLWEKGICFSLQVIVHHSEKSGSEHTAETEADAMRESYLLVCSHGLLSLLS